MKRIALTGKNGEGKYALVDDEDFEYLAGFQWVLAGRGYAATFVGIGKKRRIVLMARLICGNPEGLEVDHIDHNKLNNQRNNLRICTRAQNGANFLKPDTNSSGYKGVHLHQGKWVAMLKKDGETIYLGRFTKSKAAARVYDTAASVLFGEFAVLNFPKQRHPLN